MYKWLIFQNYFLTCQTKMLFFNSLACIINTIYSLIYSLIITIFLSHLIILKISIIFFTISLLFNKHIFLKNFTQAQREQNQ